MSFYSTTGAPTICYHPAGQVVGLGLLLTNHIAAQTKSCLSAPTNRTLRNWKSRQTTGSRQYYYRHAGHSDI
jgi:hypothetical protein